MNLTDTTFASLDPALAEAVAAHGDELYSVCDNVRGFADYLAAAHTIERESLFEGLTQEDYSDDNAWYSFRDYCRLMTNVVRRQSRMHTHYEYEDIGAHVMRTQRSFWYRYLALLPLETAIREATKVAHRVQNAYRIHVERVSPGHLTFTIQDTPAMRALAFGSECRYMTGVLRALLGHHGVRNATISHPVCGKSLRSLLVRHYAVEPERMRWTAEGVSVDGVLVAIPLTAADLVVQAPLLQPAQSAAAYEVVRDLEWRGLTILRKGEIYGAPCCLVSVDYQPVRFYERLKRFLFSREQQLQDHVQELGTQIQFAREQLFETQRALYDSRLRSSILRLYVRPSLVERIDRGENPLELRPREAPVAILFNDIIGFTSLSERLTPTQVVDLLNLHFDSTCSIVYDHGGEVDKIMGDCVLGIFEDASGALDAAIAIHQALERNRATAIERFGVHLRAGTGLHYGPVIIGNVGGRRKLDYTIIGDPVNCASRIQRLTRKYERSLLVSDDFVATLGDQSTLERVGSEILSGRSTPTGLWAPLHLPPDNRTIAVAATITPPSQPSPSSRPVPN